MTDDTSNVVPFPVPPRRDLVAAFSRLEALAAQRAEAVAAYPWIEQLTDRLLHADWVLMQLQDALCPFPVAEPGPAVGLFDPRQEAMKMLAAARTLVGAYFEPASKEPGHD